MFVDCTLITTSSEVKSIRTFRIVITRKSSALCLESNQQLNMDYNKFLTKISRNKRYSKIRQLAKHIGNGNVYQLAGGVPTPDIFCFRRATFTLNDGSELEIDEKLMRVAQQYGKTDGYEPLLEIITNLQSRLHSPPNETWTTTLTTGCQEAVCTVFQMILEEGDYLIGSEYAYSSCLDVVRPMGVKYLEVETDKHGMKADSLLKVLNRWTPEFCRQNKGEAPKLIYVVPNGGNPDSITLSTERRIQIYKIAKEYDLLIVEDDPYQFLVYDQEIPPSFLSLDTDGRVLRCDSISKIIAPGFRLGFLTGAKPFVNTAIMTLQVSTQQPCCLSQVVLYKLFLKWGYEGFINNANRARNAFRKKKDIAEKYVKKWLNDLVEVDPASGGLFLWVKIKGVEDASEICAKCVDRKLLLGAGSWFTYSEKASPYFRLSFSLTTEDEMDNALRILAEVIRKHLNTSDANGTCQ